MSGRSRAPVWTRPTWRDHFNASASVECPSCGLEAIARSAGVRVPAEDRAEAESLSRAMGLAFRIDEPGAKGPRSERGLVAVVRAPDLQPLSGFAAMRAGVVLVCGSCGLRRVEDLIDYPRRAWFRCTVHGRPFWGVGRGHLRELREYLERGSSSRRSYLVRAGPVHKLHGDIMRHREEAIGCIDRMLGPGWRPG